MVSYALCIRRLERHRKARVVVRSFWHPSIQRTAGLLSDLAQPASFFEGHVERLAGLVDKFIDLVSGHDQRWRDDHSVAHSPHYQTIDDAEITAQRADLTGLCKALALVLVTHKFQGANQTDSTRLPYQRMVLKFRPTLLEIRPDIVLHAFHDP